MKSAMCLSFLIIFLSPTFPFSRGVRNLIITTPWPSLRWLVLDQTGKLIILVCPSRGANYGIVGVGELVLQEGGSAGIDSCLVLFLLMLGNISGSCVSPFSLHLLCSLVIPSTYSPSITTVFIISLPGNSSYTPNPLKGELGGLP